MNCCCLKCDQFFIIIILNSVHSRYKEYFQSGCISVHLRCGAQGGTAKALVLPCKGLAVKARQFYLRSLTPLFVAGCGPQQLKASHLAKSAAILQVGDN